MQENQIDTSKLSPEIKAIIDGQNKTIEDLKALVQNSVKSVVSAEKIATVKKLIAGEKLPETWVSRVNIESETSIVDQVKALKDEYVHIQTGGNPQPDTERTVEEWTKLMNSDNGNNGVVDLGVK